MLSKTQKASLTEGPIFWRITAFALPIMLTGILQTLYNMADHIVVGRFSGDPDALAAVGSTGTTINLMLNLVIGIAAGVGVVVAQLYGAKRFDELSRAVHTAIAFSFICGIVLLVLFLPLSKPILELVGIREDIIDKSALYLRIICIGFPATTVFNFGAAVLRAVGDSKTPLYILSAAGITNVALNLLFVICFDMAVDGVAYATIISQYVSAVAVLAVLAHRKGEYYAFSPKKLAIDKRLLIRIVRNGVPIGIQSAAFSVSNVFITSAINTFPTTTVTANTIAGSIDGITYIAMNSYQQAAMTFSGQNYGAKKYSRVNKVVIYSLIQVTVVGLLVGMTELAFAEQLAGLFVDVNDPNRRLILETAHEIMKHILTFYFLCGIMEVFSGTLRGLGYALSPMLISFLGACVLRIIWVTVIFRIERFNNIPGLLMQYPVSWVITIAAFAIFFFGVARKRLNGMEEKTEK